MELKGAATLDDVYQTLSPDTFIKRKPTARFL